jgi:hypothetical protein
MIPWTSNLVQFYFVYRRCTFNNPVQLARWPPISGGTARLARWHVARAAWADAGMGVPPAASPACGLAPHAVRRRLCEWALPPPSLPASWCGACRHRWCWHPAKADRPKFRCLKKEKEATNFQWMLGFPPVKLFACDMQCVVFLPVYLMLWNTVLYSK